MLKSLKNLLGFSLLGFIGVWIGCSSDSAPVAPYSASKTHDTTPIVTAATEAVFTDDNLLRAVREAVFPAGTPAVTTLTRDDLSGLKVLKASNKGIKSLSGLEYATNLDTLVLNRNSITDVTPLAGLTSLEYLNLGSNKITSLDSLARLTNLEYLNLPFNKIRDVSPLASLTNLEYLDLYTNYDVDDISSLASLTKLTHFGIGGSDGGGVRNNLSQGLVANMANSPSCHKPSK